MHCANLKFLRDISGPGRPVLGGGRKANGNRRASQFLPEKGFRLCAGVPYAREEIYYRYGDATPPQAEAMAKVLADASGYRLVPEGIASMGGFKDWFIQCMRRPGFTIEAGRGRNPLPPSDFPRFTSS